jgi:hypothetical protein
MIDPLYVLRDVEVPVGARARVRARIEAELDRSPRRTLPLALGFTATAALAVLLALLLWPRSQTRNDVVLPSVPTPEVQPAAPVVAADPWAAPASDRVAAPVPSRALESQLAAILDDAQPFVHTMQLTIRVIAGSVHVAKPVITTETIELTPRPSAKPSAAKAAPASTAAEPEPVPTEQPAEAAAPPPDQLAEAVREYRAATALESSDPLAAVNAWQAWRARWSQTALAHGADLRLLALLDKLDRRAEATLLAREFLRRYPRSPRRADVERMLEGAR